MPVSKCFPANRSERSGCASRTNTVRMPHVEAAVGQIRQITIGVVRNSSYRVKQLSSNEFHFGSWKGWVKGRLGEQIPSFVPVLLNAHQRERGEIVARTSVDLCAGLDQPRGERILVVLR